MEGGAFCELVVDTISVVDDVVTVTELDLSDTCTGEEGSLSVFSVLIAVGCCNMISNFPPH